MGEQKKQFQQTDDQQEPPKPSAPRTVTLSDGSVWELVRGDAWYAVKLPPTGVWLGGFDLPRAGDDLTAVDLRAIADVLDPPSAPLSSEGEYTCLHHAPFGAPTACCADAIWNPKRATTSAPLPSFAAWKDDAKVKAAHLELASAFTNYMQHLDSLSPIRPHMMRIEAAETALCEAVSACHADSARLDWLDRNRVACDASATDWRTWYCDRHGEGADILSSASTIREAIDMAREKFDV